MLQCTNVGVHETTRGLFRNIKTKSFKSTSFIYIQLKLQRK